MGHGETCAIAVMAKAPRPNHVKTRLVPPLTPHEAASLNACFLRDITENICAAARAAPIAGFVAYAPAGGEALFDGMLAPGTDLVLADGSLDVPPGVDGFGRSLLHAATALHPQTLMAFRLSDEILPRKYGYPFKIRVPTKLGFKNPKFVTTIYVTNQRPHGFWTDRGYNWFSGI